MTVALQEGLASGVRPVPAASPVLKTEFALSADLSWLARHRLAVADVRDAIRLYRLCATLAWLDIKGRYRGSVLGPIWLTLSTAVMVAALGALLDAVPHQSARLSAVPGAVARALGFPADPGFGSLHLLYAGRGH